MKTKNTSENKAKFFALYHGQEIAIQKTTHGSEMLPVNVCNTTLKIAPCWHLSLRSISSLTDEEAIQIANIFTEKNPVLFGKIIVSEKILNENSSFDVLILRDYSSIKSAYPKQSFAFSYSITKSGNIKVLGSGDFTNSLGVTDYLRSIGILIPWMDLSVEDLDEYGWAKLMV